MPATSLPVLVESAPECDKAFYFYGQALLAMSRERAQLRVDEGRTKYDTLNTNGGGIEAKLQEVNREVWELR